MSRHQPHRNQPSGPDSFANGCRGKKGFPSKGSARGVVRVMLATGAARAAAYGTYKCKACGKWHNGGRRGA